MTKEIATIVYCILIVPNGFFFILVSLQLSGSDCKKYSVNNTGPCLNGGTIIDCGSELVGSIKCVCPPNFTGRFCQYKIVTVSKNVFTKMRFCLFVCWFVLFYFRVCFACLFCVLIYFQSTLSIEVYSNVLEVYNMLSRSNLRKCNFTQMRL